MSALTGRPSGLHSFLRAASGMGAIFAGMVIFSTAGCSAGSSGSSSGPTIQGTPAPITRQGTLNVWMVDTPTTPTITRIDVTVNRVDADVNGQWTPLTSNPQTVNLLELATTEHTLASQLLPEGHYSRLRVVPGAATVTDTSGQHPVTLSGVGPDGMEIPVDFTIGNGTVTDVLLDFDAARSFQRQADGSYALSPVIPAFVRSQIADISGSIVSQGGTPLPGAKVVAVYRSGSAYPLGTEVASAYALPPNGAFRLWGLQPGTYTLNVAYTDPTTGNTVVTSVPSVPAMAGQTTALNPTSIAGYR